MIGAGGSIRHPEKGSVDRQTQLETHFQTVIRTMDELVRLDDIFELGRAVARGFCELGAIMNWVLLREDNRLRALARWPEAPTDALFATVKQGELMDFAIPLDARRHPYVMALADGAPRQIRGAESIAAHLSNVFDVPVELMPKVQQSLSGKSSIVLPLMAGDEPMGVAALNYPEDIAQTQLDAFDIFARSAATLLRFKREVIGRERLVAQLETALEKERQTRVELARAERLAALGEMAAVVAHEIRNPLAIMQNSLTSLKRHIKEDPESELLQQILVEETQRVERIIDEMLAFASPKHARRHVVDMREILTRAVFSAREQCRPHGAQSIREQIEGPIPRVLGDAHSLGQAMVNLIVNAYQATGNAGRVDVEAEAVAPEAERVVRICIRDDGPGMDAVTLAQVWEPFFTTKARGTGLGLAIVKRIVEAHGGRIDIASTPETGTEVTLELPAMPDDEPQNPA